MRGTLSIPPSPSSRAERCVCIIITIIIIIIIITIAAMAKARPAMPASVQPVISLSCTPSLERSQPGSRGGERGGSLLLQPFRSECQYAGGKKRELWFWTCSPCYLACTSERAPRLDTGF